MKKILLLILGLSILSCQQEELTVIEGQEEASLLDDGQLTGLIKSVSSHDGSYDDIVDSSPCFSIDFPYQIIVNGEQHNVNSISDLAGFKEDDAIEPVFPVDITFANYLQDSINSMNELQDYIDRCASGVMYNDRIVCVDFIYPVELSVYDPVTSDFGVISLQHDKQTFTTIEQMDVGMRVSIRFPLTLQHTDGTSMEISGNGDLKQTILDMLPGCK